MKPSEWLQSIKGHYPESVLFPKDELPREDARRFASLWLVEGIPFAFRDYPGCFVAARDVIASNLGISFRDVSLTGSGRLGYSLHPSRFGREYDSTRSDLDLFLVSDRWFEQLSSQAEQFITDYNTGDVKPRNESEERFWPSNVSQLRKSIEDGYIDPRRVPTLNRYPVVQRLVNEAFLFGNKINEWAGIEMVTTCSIRVYKNWSCVLNRISFNVRSAIKYRETLSNGELSQK